MLQTFFFGLEKEFHDGMDSGNYRWRQERYKLWAQMGSKKWIRSMESWFKGEIALFLERNTPRLVSEWDCEFPSGTGKIDHWVRFGKDFPPLALEVKCLVEGLQGNGKIDYLANMEGVALDLKKSMPEGAQVYCLLFMYPRPSEKRLQAIRKSLDFFVRKLKVDAKISWKGPYYDSPESGLYIDKVELARV